MPADFSPIPALPAPLAYHREVVSYLKETEPELWRWASSDEVIGKYVEEIRTGMLRTNYRLDADAHPELAERCGAVAQRLNVAAPVTLYQAAGGLGMNAMLCHLPGEAHIIFTGPILTTLKGGELDAVIAHELSHYRLWEMEGGDFLIADRLLVAAANDRRATVAHSQTARRFRLYTEVFADRGSLAGCGELEIAVAALVKTETGFQDVSGASYLRQADEIFSHGDATTQGIDHPETFIRARALRLWSEDNAEIDAWLASTIEGPLSVDELDLAGQRRMSQLTRRFLGQILRPRWFQSEPALAHARGFFPDFAPASLADDTLIEALNTGDASTREYLSYLLLDFAAVDKDLEDLPLASALDWSARLGIVDQFEKLAAKELGIGKRQLTKLKKEATTMLNRAETQTL